MIVLCKRGSRRLARRNIPKWFTAKCSSNPSSVMYRFVNSMSPCNIRISSLNQIKYVETCFIEFLSINIREKWLSYIHKLPSFRLQNISWKLFDWFHGRQIKFFYSNIVISSASYDILICYYTLKPKGLI